MEVPSAYRRHVYEHNQWMIAYGNLLFSINRQPYVWWYCQKTIMRAKKAKKTGKSVTPSCPSYLGWAVTCRDAHPKRSASCALWHGGKPAHDGRSLRPFSRGNRACSPFCDCGAGMFFSFLNSYFMLLFLGLGCKSTHLFPIHQEFLENLLQQHEISGFLCAQMAFFIHGLSTFV